MSEPLVSRTRIRERALAGEVLLGAFGNLGSTLAAELVGRAGADWFLVDLEHGAGTEADLLGILRAIQLTGAAALVRPEEATRLRIGRAMDLGAEGVMLPRIDTPDEARRAVSWLRWPPDGARGLALLTRGARLADVGHDRIGELNVHPLAIVQIETAPALEHVEEIAAIDGVDVLFVGPTDLSHALGIPGQFEHQTFRDALQHVLAACRRTGSSAGILARRPDDAARFVEQGFRFVGVGSDGSFVLDGARAALATARGSAG
ncbi:MAG TPA: aldolase/citrate lyase family protein [Candidatus Limnocylindrales bacterium]|nr:aldolase/citrate lyase family protein [Candidatus Limnocylindrales bacterium]